MHLAGMQLILFTYTYFLNYKSDNKKGKVQDDF